jgi:hypothetical protein
MATRIPLFFDSVDYSPEQFANSDDMVLGKISLGGVGGVAVDGGHNEAEHFAVPTEDDSLATKGYVDAVASGLDPHESVIVKTDIGLGTQADLQGSGGSGSITLIAETMDVKTFGEAGWTTITFSSPADIAAVAAAINAQYGATIAFVDGNNIDMYDTHYGKNSQVETQNVDAAITTQVGIVNDSDVSGTGFTAAGSEVGKTLTAPDDASTWNTIDGRLLVVGERIVVTAEAGVDTVADIDNGIYDVTTLGDDGGASLVLTRTTDADTGGAPEMHQGVYVFVQEGTLGINTGWNVVTVDPIVVDTTPILWSQFTAAPTYDFAQGLKKDLNSVEVELDDDADAATQGAAGGSSGLEFDVDTAAGQLRVAVLPAGGLERGATGLAVNLDGSTLQLDNGGAGTGVSVKGVPNLFEVGGSATSQTPNTGVVTAANLNTLTAGVASNADSLHTHASSPATEAPKIETDWVAGAAGVNEWYPVYVDATTEAVSEADTDTATKCAVIGIANADAAVSVAVGIVSAGLQAGAITGEGFAAGDRIWLATGGGLANVAPGGGKRVVEIGYAKNATDLFVKIVDRGRKAA